MDESPSYHFAVDRRCNPTPALRFITNSEYIEETTAHNGASSVAVAIASVRANVPRILDQLRFADLVPADLATLQPAHGLRRRRVCTRRPALVRWPRPPLSRHLDQPAAGHLRGLRDGDQVPRRQHA